MFAVTYRTKHWGLLLFRLLLGSVFVIHGWQKLDPSKWEMIGSAASNVGMNFAPAFWGFMAMFSELVGGGLIILGFLYIPATILTAFTMLVAMTFDAKGIKDGMAFFPAFKVLLAAFMLFFLSVSALLIGPGKFSLDALICKKKCPEGGCGCGCNGCADGTCKIK